MVRTFEVTNLTLQVNKLTIDFYRVKKLTKNVYTCFLRDSVAYIESPYVINKRVPGKLQIEFF